MKKLFDKKKKLVRDTLSVGHKLDLLIVEKYGFHYSETDDDAIIDSLDYGTGAITFEEFDRRMKQYKEDFDAEIPFRCIP